MLDMVEEYSVFCCNSIGRILKTVFSTRWNKLHNKRWVSGGAKVNVTTSDSAWILKIDELVN